MDKKEKIARFLSTIYHGGMMNGIDYIIRIHEEIIKYEYPLTIKMKINELIKEEMQNWKKFINFIPDIEKIIKKEK